MADNPNTPHGFRLVGTRSGRLPAIHKYYVTTASQNLFIGDPVVIDGTGTTSGLANVDIANPASGTTTGIIVGFVPAELVTAPNIPAATYLASGASASVLVCDDPDAFFEIQEDSDGGAIASTAIGEFCDFVVGTGNTTTGLSACMLDSSSAATGDNVRLERIVPREDNVLGNNYCKWIVSINEHTFRAVTTAV